MPKGIYKKTKRHIEKLKPHLLRNFEKVKVCETCRRFIGKKKHKCPTKKERQKIQQYRKGKTFKELYGKKQAEEIRIKMETNNPRYWLGKKRRKETTEKAVKTRLKRIKAGKIKPYWKGKKRNKKDREKMSNSQIGINSGENHYNWKGGISDEIKKRWCSLEYQKWRKKVFEKDNHTCQECGKKSKKGLGKTVTLNAHHIKSIYKYPKLMFKISNGKTLCSNCHLEYHKKNGFK